MQNGSGSRCHVVIYARVSSKEQEREGFSIPAQLQLLRKYAADQRMVVLEEFVDVESASVAGRSGFGQMLAFLKKNKAKCQTILVEKTDRLYRNLKDYVTVDEAAVTTHFVKESTTLSPDARSSDQFMHGIKVLMARNYSQNLGEETHKGMLQKARSGLYPSFAPLGYRNLEAANGQRIIVPDSDALTIKRLFEEFAIGQYSLKDLARKASKEGLTLRGRPLYKSTLQQVLRKRIYTGDFDWDGDTYKGTHEPVVAREVWEKVQAILNRKSENRQHRIKHDFAFSGFVRCGHCGCQLVGEMKKGRYVYYHCTGYRGKCPDPYTREETLRNKFTATLRSLVIPPQVLAWLSEYVAGTDMNENAAREKALNRIDEQRRRIEQKLTTMYEDKLEERISSDFFDRKAGELRAQEAELLRRLNEIRTAEPAPIEDAINLIDLTSRAAELFDLQPVREQQRFLRLVLKSATWQSGELQTEFEEPFESLRVSNRLSRTKHIQNGVPKADFQDWLPR